MLEQVWKNVAGSRFDAKVSGGEVYITIPRGSNLTIYDFSLFIARLQDSLSSTAEFVGKLGEDGTTEIVLKFSPIAKEPEKREEPIEEVVKEESSKEEVPIEAPKKRTRKKKEEVPVVEAPIEESSMEEQVSLEKVSEGEQIL